MLLYVKSLNFSRIMAIINKYIYKMYFDFVALFCFNIINIIAHLYLVSEDFGQYTITVILSINTTLHCSVCLSLFLSLSCTHIPTLKNSNSSLVESKGIIITNLRCYYVSHVIQCAIQFLLLHCLELSFPTLFSVILTLLQLSPFSPLTLSPPQFMSFLTLVVDIRLWVLR